MIVYRQTDVDVPFFWESDRQPAQRWHDTGEGPVQYASSTPDAAWSEFLRHAGIDDPADLDGVNRVMWAIEIPGPGNAATSEHAATPAEAVAWVAAVGRPAADIIPRVRYLR